jgi:sec-independent protein translocase protein TatA
VENERQKNEIIAKSFGIRPEGKTDEELKKLVAEKMGQKKIDDPENQKTG